MDQWFLASSMLDGILSAAVFPVLVLLVIPQIYPAFQKTAIRLHDVADDQSLVTEGACGEGEAVAEVEIITELLLQLSWNLPAHRPDFALEEMILAVSQLLRSFAHVSSPCCPLTIPFVFAVPSDAQL